MGASSFLSTLFLVTGLLGVQCDNEIRTDDGNSTPAEPKTVRVLYGESHGISWTDLSDNDRLPPLLTHRYIDVFSVDYHYGRKLIFYTGWGMIWRFPMDATGGQVQGEPVMEENPGAAAVAVDWERDRLYWTSPGSQSVWSSNLAGSDRDVIIPNTGNITIGNNVVVDPYMRYLFVATNSGHSLRSSLDGDHLVRLSHGLRLTSVALDLHNRRLYVSGNRDFAPALISSDYDGNDVIDYPLNHGADWWVRLVSIDVFSSGDLPQVFWVHHGWHDRDTAWRMQLSNGQLSWQKEYTASGTVLDPETRIWCVKVWHPDVQSRPKYMEKEKLQSVTTSASNSSGYGTVTDVGCGASPPFWTKQSLMFQTAVCLLLSTVLR